MKYLKNFALVLLTMLSLFCLVSVPGAFIQALVLVFVLYVVFGMLAAFGNIKIALVNIFILSVALAVCPTTDMSEILNNQALTAITFITAALGYLGVFVGVYRLQVKNV